MTQDIRWRVGLDGVQQVQQGANQVASSFEQMGRSTGAIDKAAGALASIASAGRLVAGMAITHELTQAAAAAIQTADSITVLRNQLTLATGSAAAAGKAYGELYGIAQRSRTSFVELGGTYASIARATDGLGVSQTKLLTVTQAIGNAMAISGGSAAGMQAALTQLGQGLASGTLRGDELNSVLEQTPRLARAIADGMGVSVGQLRALGQEGKITAETIINALESQSATLAREVEGSVVTVSQAMTQVTNAATKAIGELNQATGATASISTSMQGLSSTIDDVSDRFVRARAEGRGFIAALATAQVMAVAEAMGQIDIRAANVGRRLKEAEKELAQLQARLAAEGGFYLTAKTAEAAQLVERLKEAKKAQDALNAPDARDQTQYKTRSQSYASFEAQQVKDLEALAEARNKALGVNDAWVKQLQVLADARAKGLITEQEHVALAQKITQATYQKAAATKKDADEMGDAVKAFNDLSRAGREWLRTIEVTNAGMQRELDLGRQLTEGEKQHLELTEKLARGQLVLSEAQRRAAGAAIDLGQAMRSNIAWQRETADENVRSYEALQGQTDALEQRATAMRTSNDQTLLGAGALREVQQAELLAAAAAKERRAVLMDNIDPRIADEYRRQAAALREQAAQSGRAASIEATRDAAQAWQRMADDAGAALANALMAGGQDAGEQLENYFKTLVLRPIFQAAVQPLANTVVQLLAGFSGGGAAAGGTGGMGANSWLSAASAAGQLGGGWSNIASSVGSWLGMSSAPAAAGAAGAAATGSAAAGSTAAAGSAAASSGAASAIPIIGWIVAAIMASKSAYEGGNTLDMLRDVKGYGVGKFEADKYDTLQSLGMSEKWAQILSGAPITARLFGHKASVSGYGIGSYAGNTFAQEGRAPIEFGRNILGGGADQSLQGLVATVAEGLTASAGLFGGSQTQGLRIGALTDRDRENEVAALLGYFRADNSLIAGTQTGSGSFGTGGPGRAASKIKSEELEDWIAEQMPVLILQGLQQSDLTDRFETYFDSVGAAQLTPELASAMLATASAVQQLTDSFGPLGGAFSQLDDLSVATVEKLAKASGGFDALGQAANRYYEGFFSEAERTEDAWAGITSTLEKAGLALPKTKAEFRGVVDSLDLQSEAGQKAFVALMKVSGAFASLTDSAIDAAEASAAAAEKLKQEADARGQLLEAAIAENLPKFLTPADQRTFAYQRIQGDLQDAGVSIALDKLMGASKAEVLAFAKSFVNLADGASTAEIAVVGAAGALADLSDSAADAAARQREVLAEQQADAIAKQKVLDAAFDGMVASLKDGVVGAYQTVAQLIGSERERAESEAEKSLRTLEQQADKVSRTYSGLVESLGTSLQQLTGQLAGDGGRASAMRTLQQALGDLRSGQAIDTDKVRAAAGTVSRVDASEFGSALEYRRALATTANVIRDVSAAARQQQSTELGAIAAQQVKIESELAKQLDTLDDQLKQARSAAGSLVSIDDGVRTVADAIARLSAAMGAVSAAEGKPGAPTGQWVPSGGAEVWAATGGAVAIRESGAGADGAVIRGKTGNKFTIAEAQAFVNELLAAGDVAGIHARAIAEGIDSSSLDALMGWPAGTSLAEAQRRGLRAFEAGTAYVPNTGLALVHEGERILPAADNAALMRMLSEEGGGELAAEVRTLRSELMAALEALRAQSMSNEAVIAGNTGKTARLLDDVINGGASVRTEVAA